MPSPQQKILDFFILALLTTLVGVLSHWPTALANTSDPGRTPSGLPMVRVTGKGLDRDHTPPFTRPQARPYPEFPADAIRSAEPNGYLPGIAGVSNAGAATYTIPLDVPPGVAGMQPELALSYSSSAGNGVLGVGWTLSGGSQIQRCNKTLRTNGVTAGIEYGIDDVFCLNAERLVKVGTSQSGYPEFRTESNPFDRIVWELGDNRFKVWSKDGTISTYAPITVPQYKAIDPNVDNDPSTPSSAQPEYLRVQQKFVLDVTPLWVLRQREDRSGNSVRYNYFQSPPNAKNGVEVLLNDISYTHSAAGSGANRSVRLHYETREDKEFAYSNGIRMESNFRLARLTMHAPKSPGDSSQTEQWEYQLAYGESISTQRSELTSVRKCAQGACGWAKQFTWNQAASDESGNYRISGTLDYTPITPKVMSAYLYDDLLESNYDETNLEGKFRTTLTPIHMDADGDGRTDILQLDTSKIDCWWDCEYPAGIMNTVQWRMFLSSKGYQGTPLSSSLDLYGIKQLHSLMANPANSSKTFQFPEPGTIRAADVDADGREELISGFTWRWSESDSYDFGFYYRALKWGGANGDSSGFADLLPKASNSLPFGLVAPIELKDMYEQWDSAREHFRLPTWNLVDATGDGRLDLVEDALVRANLGLSASGEWLLVPTQKPTNIVEKSWRWGATNRGADAADVDGDGRGELLVTFPSLINSPDSLLDGMGLLPEEDVQAIGSDSSGNLQVPRDLTGIVKSWAPYATLESCGAIDCDFLNPSIRQHSLMGDFNGDGLKDSFLYEFFDGEQIAISSFIQWNTGKGFLQPSPTWPTFGRWDYLRLRVRSGNGDITGAVDNINHIRGAFDVFDINADGRDDIVVKSASSVPLPFPGEQFVLPEAYNATVYISNGDGSFRRQDNAFRLLAWSKKAGYGSSKPGNYDGDAAPEYLLIGNQALHVLDLEVGPVDNIAQIADEKAGRPRELFFYEDKVGWATDLNDPSDCKYPIRCPSQMGKVVSQHSSAHGYDKNGQTIYRRTKYTFSDPRIDLRGRGFLGYETIQTVDLDSGAESVTRYANHALLVGEFYPYAGMATETTVSTPILEQPADGKPNLVAGDVRARVSKTVNTPAYKLLYGGKTFFSYVAASSTDVREVTMNLKLVNGQPRLAALIANSPAPISFTDVVAKYDDYGNQTFMSRAILGGETRTFTTSFKNETSSWLIGLPEVEQVSSSSVIRETAYSYTAAGLLDRIKVMPNHPNASMRSTTYLVYDNRGLPIQVGVAAPNVPLRVTNLYYDADSVFQVQTINALGHAATTLFHPGLGVPVISEDVLGVISKAYYDGFGRPRATDSPTALDVTNIHYSSHKTALGVTMGIQVKASLSDGEEMTTAHDEDGRVVESIVGGFEGQPLHARTDYNLFGRVVRQTRRAKGAASSYASEAGFDTLGRVLWAVAPDGVKQSYVHLPRHEVSTDALGHERHVYLDSNMRPARTEEVLVTPGQPPQTLKTVLQYGAFDSLIGHTDAKGNTISIRYDELGRRIRMTDPDAGVRTWAYNGLGEVVLEETPMTGHSRSTNYDDLGRPVAVTDSEGSTLFYWDSATNGKGQLGGAVRTGVDYISELYEYDALGRPSVQRTQLHDAATGSVVEHFAFATKYDAFGRVSALEYPSDPSGERFTVSFEFNAYGFARKVLRSKLGVATAVDTWEVLSRDENLALRKSQFGNQLQTIYARQPATGILESIATGKPGALASKFSVAYTYNGVRNVKTRNWTWGDQSVSEAFQYDDLDRLSHWQVSGPVAGGAATYQYQYDLLGNLESIQKGATTVFAGIYGVGGRPNALKSFADNPSGVAGVGVAIVPQYDSAGRQTVSGARATTFTNADLPRSVTVAGQVTRMRYGPRGGRVEKAGGDGRTVYVGGLYEKRESGNKVEHVYLVPGETGIVAQVTRSETGANSVSEKVVYLERDHLGSSSASFAEDGSTEGQIFDPWGTRIFYSGPAAGSQLLDKVKHGFTSHRHETDLGWIDMQARMYDPLQRRFTSPDPLVADPLFSPGRNRYSYVLNNPMRYADPSGMEPSPAIGEQGDANTAGAFVSGAITPTGTIYFSTDAIKGWRAARGDSKPGAVTETSVFALPDRYQDLAGQDLRVVETRSGGKFGDIGPDMRDLRPREIRSIGDTVVGNRLAGVVNGARAFERITNPAQKHSDRIDVVADVLAVGGLMLEVTGLARSVFAGRTPANVVGPGQIRGRGPALVGTRTPVAAGPTVQVAVGNSYGYATETYGSVVAKLATRLEGKVTGRVAVGTGGHGDGGSVNFINTPGLVEEAFLLEDMDLGWGSRIDVYDLRNPADLAAFQRIEDAARAGASNDATIRAWCFSAEDAL